VVIAILFSESATGGYSFAVLNTEACETRESQADRCHMERWTFQFVPIMVFAGKLHVR
jgi:hypothetical protein